jgi:hypothetical protein
MSYSLRLKGFFFACVIGFALAARLALALPIGLFGPMGGLADAANELAIVVALLAACRRTERLKCYYAKRAVLRVMEAGWVKWLAALEAQKSAAIAPSESLLKKVA